MKRLKQLIAFVLFLCITISLLPPVQIVRSATVTHRYELDTDGIDLDASYLIVNTGTAGNANALKFRYGNTSSTQKFTNQALQVQMDAEGKRYIATGFTDEAECLFQFSGTEGGKITHGSYAIDLRNGAYTTDTNPQSLTFTEVGNGAYRIHYSTSSWFWSTTYYLRFNSSSWSSSTTSSTVYLYKQVEYEVGYDVHFDGNGYTSGQLPADEEKLDSGYPYTIPEPVELRKDIGQDTWLFLCWNTKADGSGIEYKPGDEIVITEDLTLYADWYQQTKYAVTMATKLNGVRTDVDKISGQDKTFAIQRDGSDTYLPMERTEEGTYVAKVTENGDYIVYSRVDDGEYEPVHGHKVTIYNQDGITICQHFTVSYNAQNGVWAEGQDPGSQMCHALESVTLTSNIPTLENNRFLGWQDQDGKIYAAGEQITSVEKEIVLTALWEKTISVTVNVNIDHNADGGDDRDQSMHDIIFTLMRMENNVNLPIEERILSEDYVYDPATNITTYQVVFANMPQGIYHVSSTKSNYDTSISYTGSANENQVVTINAKYRPENFDLHFNVVVNADEDEKHLMPKAVNVKVSYWGFDGNDVLGWHIITQQEGTNAPTTITIGEDGRGTGYYPVWRCWSGGIQPYLYRVEVISYVMPDDSIVAATSNDKITYISTASGLYQATVTIKNGGAEPTYPGKSDLLGAYVENEAQNGIPTVTVEVNPFTVTFDAAAGTLNGNSGLVLENQYQYPDPALYVPVPADENVMFLGWFDQYGNPAGELAGDYLTEDVIFTAQYGTGITLSGVVEVAATYKQDGETVDIHAVDRLAEVMVLVRRQIGNQFVTLDSKLVPVTYEDNAAYGTAQYTFENLPDDGTNYQISVLAANYDSLYDNDLDGNFAADEDIVTQDTLNARLLFNPEIYRVGLEVDVSQIAAGYRPTSALAEILYRDLGDVNPFDIISQHTVPPYGVEIELDKMGQGTGADDVWVRHVDGTYYEYQIALSKLYGSVDGAYTKEGTEYTVDSPFTVVYGPPSSQLKQTADGEGTLVATLVPKEYPVILDLNLEGDTKTPVRGMDNFLVDDGTGNVSYAYIHTWSYASDFEAYPYRDGYVFLGWQENADTANDKELVVDDGVIHVGAALAKPVTLTAQWRALTEGEYTIRHLELNTNKVLHGAQAFGSVVAGTQVAADDFDLSIPGYEYAGALIDGNYVHKSNNPYMVVSSDPQENMMVIYYLPDSSSGYTEQVESNLSAQKYAVLEDNGTYTITLDTYTKANPITTQILYNTPLDVVLVLDQSGSMHTNQALDDLKAAVDGFISLLANHGRNNAVDHRVAIVGYASNYDDGYTNPQYPTAGKEGSYLWYNTGVFGVHGDFHPYSTTGFNYTEYDGLVSPDGVYYTKAHDEYLLLTYHEEYRHQITEEEAREALLDNIPVYGYVEGQFIELTRNSSGLWLYGDKKLYTSESFFTYHTDVWTHREGLERREIHAYGVGNAFQEVGEHQGVYTREATKDANPMKSLYEEALMPISLGANGSGGITPGLTLATEKLGGNGMTRVSYGMEMANKVFEANPLENGSNRQRIVIVFTDGKPGDGSNFYEDEANKALEYANTAINHYGAEIYAIGLYGDDVVAAESDQVFFMNGLSSNYPNATKMSDVWVDTTYKLAESNIRLNLAGPYYVNVGDSYYLLTLKSVYDRQTKIYYNSWGYTDNSGTRVVISQTPNANGHPVITNNMIGDYLIYRQYGNGYKDAQNTGYYVAADKSVDLKEYFAKIMRDITTNMTTKITLDSGTIVRDIMNEGMVLTDNTVITVYTQQGNYNAETKEIDWVVDANGEPVTREMVSLQPSPSNTTAVGQENVQIKVYNMDVDNDPNNPHTVDISGYNFSEWYISSDNPTGYKMIVTITGIEARDNVQWGRSTPTNHARSGLWLPATSEEERQLLAAFNQPTTIFVERAYVLDYGKEFALTGWYFDDEGEKDADPIHLDLDIANGMNYFDTPNTKNSVGSEYGNLEYGNLRLDEETGTVYYSPTTMNWGGYDSFYVFGNTWRQTVVNQDANANGNLWNKVTVIPANNIYYEDSFITKPSINQDNGIEGFVFGEGWEIVYDNGSENADQNIENPEHLESAPYGDVHGWTDSLGDDKLYTDGSAHAAGLPTPENLADPTKRIGATASFTFTGTGVEVYSRTNAESGMVVAVLNQITIDDQGNEVSTLYESQAMDDLAMSGDYYHVPTVAFLELPYGTYNLELIVTVAITPPGPLRYEYYIDGVRIYNPLNNNSNYQADIVKDAYGLENNAVFTEIRDILLDNDKFITEIPGSTDGKQGAVFIDWIREGQGTEEDIPGEPTYTYDIGTYRAYGPKNEVYLSAGQAIVLKVDEGNTYYVGMKSLTGEAVEVNISGVDQKLNPTTMSVKHTTDMYYRVNPVDGYIVIQNGSTTEGKILSLTNLRTTNMREPVSGTGIAIVEPEMAVMMMYSFAGRLEEEEEELLPEAPTEEQTKSPVQTHTEQTLAFASTLFLSVRQWLETN